MNEIAENIKSYLGSAEMSDEEFLQHYGVKRRSGRFPFGSGEEPYQHESWFLSRVSELKKKGWTETPENIMKEFGLTTTNYRREKRIANEEQRMYDVATAKSLLKRFNGNKSEVGRAMGISESSVRSLLNAESESRMNKSKNTAERLKQEVKNKRIIDVGVDVEKDLHISRDELDTAVYMLERQGYKVHSGRIPQLLNPGQKTTQKCLCMPDVEHKEIYEFDKVKTIIDYENNTKNNPEAKKRFYYPESMDSKRLKIRYAEDGGTEKDGTIELRRGLDDLNLQGSRYAQVRILVDKTHYIKGMAMYSDNMPDGIDVIFNTNKSNTKSKMECLKEIKKDPDNPFGSNIKDFDQGGQYFYKDPKTGKEKLGLINKRADQSDWTEWNDSLPSQFLSKQSKQLATKQLDLAKANKVDEFNEIMSLNNPTIKKYYLDKFASSCDSAAVDLKAAALPGQKYHVIVPVSSLKDTEIYAPQYTPGTKLALIRYPHGGTFEIPILTVTDKNKTAKKLIGADSIDAVCINKKVADRLSGADYDGDTVMCIPTHNSKVKIDSKNELKGLKGFDNKFSYGPDPVKTYVDKDGITHYYNNGHEYKPLQKSMVNKEMRKISNLITDMTLAGASDTELAQAVKHSMVVIDAEKHKLDYKQSELDNNISYLKKKYQPHYDSDGNIIGGGGASTIISRSSGQYDAPKTKGQPKVNIKGKSWYDPTKPEGALIYKRPSDEELYYPVGNYDKNTGIKTLKTTDGKTVKYNMYNKDDVDRYTPILSGSTDKNGNPIYVSKDGKITYQTKMSTVRTTRMAYTDDAYTLVSSNKYPMELIYADYANSMKQLANEARKAKENTPRLEYNSKAKKVYAREVSELEAQLNEAMKNSVKERAVLRKVNIDVKNKISLDPTMSKEDIRKAAQRSTTKYRDELGTISRKNRAIKITDKQWEAIQSGAISENKLNEILRYSDASVLREKAMPKQRNSVSASQVNRIKAYANSNYTLNQIAEKMNLSTSTISKILKGGV